MRALEKLTWLGNRGGVEMADSNSKLADNVALRLISRVANVFATSVGLPGAFWMMNRAVSSVDKISEKIDTLRDQAVETTGSIKLIQQSQGNQARILDDHEVRLRAAESSVHNAARSN
jgi:hypothetical protein